MSAASTAPSHNGSTTDGRNNRLAVNAAWLMRLRWVAVVGQLLTIAVAALVFRVTLQLAPLLAIVAFTALTNVAFTLWVGYHNRGQTKTPLGRSEHALLVAVMTMDLLALTALLYFAGGPANPFTIFYFINLALSAVILPARWGWTLTGVAIVCLAFLFVFHVPIPELERPMTRSGDSPTNRLSLGQQGLLVALVAGAVVVIYFITRVTRELSRREQELRVAEQQRARSEKLEALGTLAAGAGHELRTPLSTIAVVANELTRHLEGVDVPDSVKEDVALIRAEVDLCRSILDRMSGNVEQATAEPSSSVTVEQLIRAVLEGPHFRDRVQVSLDNGVVERRVELPLQNVAQAIRGVLQNALDASPSDESVGLSIACEGEQLCLKIHDRGSGMSEETLARAGEPFFTTKEPGKGMGLGLFLTRSVVQRLGGSVRLGVNSDRGVTAVIHLPLTARHAATAD